MGQCITCNQFIPPKLLVVVNEDTGALQCVFCNTGQDYVTVVNDKTKEEEKIWKSDIVKKYELYLKEISKKGNVKNLVSPDSNIIMP